MIGLENKGKELIDKISKKIQDRIEKETKDSTIKVKESVKEFLQVPERIKIGFLLNSSSILFDEIYDMKTNHHHLLIEKKDVKNVFSIISLIYQKIEKKKKNIFIFEELLEIKEKIILFIPKLDLYEEEMIQSFINLCYQYQFEITIIFENFKYVSFKKCYSKIFETNFSENQLFYKVIYQLFLKEKDSLSIQLTTESLTYIYDYFNQVNHHFRMFKNLIIYDIIHHLKKEPLSYINDSIFSTDTKSFLNLLNNLNENEQNYLKNKFNTKNLKDFFIQNYQDFLKAKSLHHFGLIILSKIYIYFFENFDFYQIILLFHIDYKNYFHKLVLHIKNLNVKNNEKSFDELLNDIRNNFILKSSYNDLINLSILDLIKNVDKEFIQNFKELHLYNFLFAESYDKRPFKCNIKSDIVYSLMKPELYSLKEEPIICKTYKELIKGNFKDEKEFLQSKKYLEKIGICKGKITLKPN